MSDPNSSKKADIFKLFSAKSILIVVGAYHGAYKMLAFGVGLTVVNIIYKPRIQATEKRVKSSAGGFVTLEEMELDEKDQEMLKRNLPLWVKYDEYERVGWINKLFSDIWPFLDTAVREIILNAVKGIKLPGPLSLQADIATIGQIPLTINGIKLLDTDDEEVVMDVDITWSSNLDVKVKAVLFGMVGIPVQLEQIILGTHIRIMIKDLVPVFPCFQTLELCLLHPPQLDLSLKLMGFDLLSIPGSITLVDKLIDQFTTINMPMMWPHKKTLMNGRTQRSATLTTKMGAGITTGELEIKLFKAKGLVAYDMTLFGSSSDPFVEAFVGTPEDIYQQVKKSPGFDDQKMPNVTSTTILNSLSPDWNEEALKLYLSTKFDECILHLRMWDRNKMLPYNSYMGSIYLPLSVLMTTNDAADFSNVMKFRQCIPLSKLPPPLEISLQGGQEMVDAPSIEDQLVNWEPSDMNKHGELDFEVTFSPFAEAREQPPAHAGSDTRQATRGVVHEGTLFVKLIGADRLKIMDFFTRKADPMARLTVGMKSKWSKVCSNQRSPKWNELFTFEDVDPEKYDKLTITIFDWERFRAKRHMGSCEVKLKDVINANGATLKTTVEMQDTQGSLQLDLTWKRKVGATSS